MSDTSIFFYLFSSLILYTNGNIEANKNNALAFYKQAKIEQNITDYVDKRVDKELKSKIGNIVLIVNSIAEKRLVYEVTF